MCYIRKSALASILVICLFTGCSGVDSTGTRTTGTQPIDTPQGMIEYLQRLNLPTLEFVQLWPNDYGPGLELTTEHYRIYTTLLEPLMLSQIPGFMESAYRSYQRQLPEPIETTAKFTIYCFAERQQWEEFTKSFAGRQSVLYLKIKRGAYYLNGACVAYNIGRELTFSTLGHEGWHQFNKRHFKFRLPSWLDEGIAMQFETSRYDQGLFYFEPGRNFYRLGPLKRTLLKNSMIPLRELIAMNPGEALSTDSDTAVAAFYSQAYALVRFLREDDYGRRLSNFHQMLMGGADGHWPMSETFKEIAANRNIPLTVQWNRIVGTALFGHYIGKDVKEIEQEYKAFCRKIVYHVKFK